MRSLHSWLTGCLLLAAGACWADAKDVAPTGVLRAVYLGTNPIQARIDAQTGKPAGLVPDMVEAMARRLGLPYEVIPAANAADIVKRLGDGSADIGFMANEASRAKEVDFSDAYALMFNAFVAPADSAITATAQVDRPGTRVAAVKGQTQATVLSQSMKQATMVLLDRKPDAVQLFASGQAHVYAANRHDAEQVAAESGGKVRVLPDNFFTIEQAIAIKPGQRARMAEVNRLVAASRGEGVVEKAIARSRINGLAVAGEPRR